MCLTSSRSSIVSQIPKIVFRSPYSPRPVVLLLQHLCPLFPNSLDPLLGAAVDALVLLSGRTASMILEAVAALDQLALALLFVLRLDLVFASHEDPVGGDDEREDGYEAHHDANFLLRFHVENGQVHFVGHGGGGEGI